MAALHVLDTRYATQLNSLGQRIVEPFGDQEHLGVFAPVVLSPLLLATTVLGIHTRSCCSTMNWTTT